ncbi:MAG: hypothetical protein ABEN55_04990 [Bradymonadaceae bacterium]
MDIYEVLVRTMLAVSKGALRILQGDTDNEQTQRALDLLESVDDKLERVVNALEAEQEDAPEDDEVAPSIRSLEEELENDLQASADGGGGVGVGGVEISPQFREENVSGPTHVLPDILEKLKPIPGDIEDQHDARQEAERLQEVSRGVLVEEGPSLPSQTQAKLLEHIAARAKRIQEEGFDLKAAADAIKGLTWFSEHERPGYAHGLDQNHDPRSGRRWYADVRSTARTLDQIVEQYTGEEGDLLEGSKVNTDRVVTKMRQLLRGGQEREVAEMLQDVLGRGVDADDIRVVSLWMDHREVLEDAGVDSALKEIESFANNEAEGESGGRFGQGMLDDLTQAADGELDHLELGPDARAAAQGTWHPDRDKIWRTLEALEEAGEAYLEGGGELGESLGRFLLERGVPSYAPKESAKTMGQHGEARRFRRSEGGKAEVQQHVTIGQATDHSVQIFFEMDQTRGVWIAYLGDHLPYASE